MRLFHLKIIEKNILKHMYLLRYVTRNKKKQNVPLILWALAPTQKT